MKPRLRRTEGQCRHATRTMSGHRRSRPGAGHQNRSRSCGRDLSWRPATAAIPADGSRAGPAAESVRRRTHEPARSPLTDREAEP
jgi:hypothetical protein